MQTIVVFFALLSCAFAAPLSWYFSGTTNTSTATAIPATLSGTGSTCAASASGASSYENVTITIPTAGAYFVYGMFGRPTVDSAFLNVYTTFTPATPCTGNVAIAAATHGGAPHVYLPLTLAAATYTFVITTTVPTAGGAWSLHVNQADFSGSTSNGGKNWWVVPDNSGGSSSSLFTNCANGTTISPYISYNWTQATTGLYDINIFLGNTTVTTPQFIAALYNTTQSWVGTGTEANPANPCAAAAGFYWGITSDDSISLVTTGFGTAGVFPLVMLTAGTVYTVVVGGSDDTEVGPFGGRISPTVYFQVGPTANYAAVSPNTLPADCVSQSTGATLKVWRAFVFTAQWPTYVVDNGPGSIGFDTIAELYIGNNAGVAYTTPPDPCTGFLQCVDTGDIGPLSAAGLVVGANYTIVVTTYSSSAPSVPWFTLWAFTGNTTGSIPSNTGSNSGTNSGTHTGTNSGSTAGSTAQSTAGTTATGSAQIIAASFFLSLLGAAFALAF